MNAAFPGQVMGNAWRMAIALMIALGVAPLSGMCAAPVDPALIGSWLLDSVESGGKKEELRDVVWKIGPGGELTISTAKKELGSFTSNPETWAVRRPDHSGDVLHGTYRILGPDSFSARIAGLPADDITWKRIPPDGKPSRVSSSLMKQIAPGPAGKAPRPAFNAALAGLWEASFTLNDTRHESVWRITPDGQSLSLDVEIKSVSCTATGGRLKMIVPEGKGPEFPYKVVTKDLLELVIETDPSRPKLRCTRSGD